jgi:hypothetical protein
LGLVVWAAGGFVVVGLLWVGWRGLGFVLLITAIPALVVGA